MDPKDLLKSTEVAVNLFVEELIDDDRSEATFPELEKISREIGIHVGTIVAMVKSYGIAVGARVVPREVRGFTSNSHDRWHGKGSSATHGGSGWEQISGFAGHRG
jgi:hypothetical protein